MSYHQRAAERIVAHTVQNVAAGALHPDQAGRQLERHADYCEAQGDDGTAAVARAAAQEIAAGSIPAIELGGVTVEAGAVPEYSKEEQPTKKKKS